MTKLVYRYTVIGIYMELAIEMNLVLGTVDALRVLVVSGIIIRRSLSIGVYAMNGGGVRTYVWILR